MNEVINLFDEGFTFAFRMHGDDHPNLFSNPEIMTYRFQQVRQVWVTDDAGNPTVEREYIDIPHEVCGPDLFRFDD